MNEQEALAVLDKVGACMTGGHFVYTNKQHGSVYVNKDAVYPHTTETSRLCRAIAERFAVDNVEVVIAPAIGGVILSQWMAHHLTEMKGHEVFGVYAERFERSILKMTHGTIVSIKSADRRHDFDLHEYLHEDQEFVVRGDDFVIKRGYDKLIAGKRVLVVEDVLTTGGSAKKVVEATRALGGNVIGLGTICNRGGVTPQDVADVPNLIALVNIKLDAWDEVTCPLCAQNVPINTDVGKGREYLARKKAS